MRFSAAMDAFVFTQRLNGGQTVVELLAERFTGEDRTLVLSWTGIRTGHFRDQGAIRR